MMIITKITTTMPTRDRINDYKVKPNVVPVSQCSEIRMFDTGKCLHRYSVQSMK